MSAFTHCCMIVILPVEHLPENICGTQALSASDFLKVLEAILIVSAPCLGHAASIKASVLDILAASRAPRTLQTDAAQACTDAITAVSEAAHACWVRLLNARYALRLIHHCTLAAASVQEVRAACPLCWPQECPKQRYLL